MEYKAEIRVELHAGDLDVGRGFAFLQAPSAGGICLFVGTTRQWTSGRETVALSYQAYESMALLQMRRLVDQACAQWPIVRCVVQHRLGTVPVSDASVLVGVSTAHRADAFEACRFLIDEIKRDVPIWKMERYRDGHTEWVSPGASAPEG